MKTNSRADAVLAAHAALSEARASLDVVASVEAAVRLLDAHVARLFSHTAKVEVTRTPAVCLTVIDGPDVFGPRDRRVRELCRSLGDDVIGLLPVGTHGASLVRVS